MKLLLLTILFLLPLPIAKAEQPYEVIQLTFHKPSYTEEMAVVTAYTSRIEECDGDPFITASGERVRDGGIACPRHLEFGTRIEIDIRFIDVMIEWHLKIMVSMIFG